MTRIVDYPAPTGPIVTPARRPVPGGGSWVRRVALLIVLGIAAFGLTGCQETKAEDRAYGIELINRSRAEAGLRPLRQHPVLDAKADAWARRLRDACDLSHSRLSDGAPPEWRKLGENVGHGGNIAVVHTAYMGSPGHRANILDPSFQYVGMGVVYGQCRGEQWVFTVQEFMQA